MKFYILDLGYLESDKNVIIGLSSMGTRSNPIVQNEWIKIPVIGVLIDTGDEYILYDTGCNPEAMNGYWSNRMQETSPCYMTEDQRLENQLALCGVKPEDIHTVVLSHLHVDHAGNLQLFPHADVYVPGEDYKNALVTVHQTPDKEAQIGYAKGDLERPAHYILVYDDMELRPGIELINLPGHTAGLLGMILTLDSGVYLFPADCLYLQESYGPPERLVGSPYDSQIWHKSIAKVRNLEKKYNAKIMYGHDWEFEKTMKLAPEYYE